METDTLSAMDSELTWREISRRQRIKTPVFSLVTALREAPNGMQSTYFLLDSPDWVNIIPLTVNEAGEECVVMVRQYRHGSQRICLEFPGGLVDAGEDAGEAAVRELREETGYTPGEVEYLGSVNPNPALMGNRCSTYVAKNCTAGAPVGGDHDEFIQVVLLPVAELLAVPEEFDHAIMHAALGMFVRWRNGHR